MAQTEITPVMQPPKVGKVGDPCAMVIFGAAGDLDPPQIDSRALQPG